MIQQDIPCLPDTGAEGHLLLAALGAALLLGGLALVVQSRRGGARPDHGTTAAAVLVVALLGASAALLVGAVTPAFAAGGDYGCSSATDSPPAATAAPTTRPTSEPTATPTPPVDAECPAGNDIASLPAGDSVEWTPTIAPDPTLQPGQSGDVVYVWADNIAGYTWHVVSGTGGAPSGDCGGQPVDGGACVGYPQAVSVSAWGWDENIGEWAPLGSSGSNSGCGGGGGNN